MCFFLPQVHVHRKGSDNLLKIIPARILPTEYGGEAGPLLDHWGKDRNVLSLPSPHSHRLWSIIFRSKFASLLLLSIPFHLCKLPLLHFNPHQGQQNHHLLHKYNHLFVMYEILARTVLI